MKVQSLQGRWQNRGLRPRSARRAPPAQLTPPQRQRLGFSGVNLAVILVLKYQQTPSKRKHFMLSRMAGFQIAEHENVMFIIS